MWVTMNRLYPKEETQDIKDGHAAHWVFAEMLEGRQVSEGALAPNGVIVTEEMIDGAELLCEVVHNHSQGRQVIRRVEHQIPITSIHSECFGTPDVFQFDQQHMQVDLFDYKFGHRFVDEYENWQCIAYAIGIIDGLAEYLNIPAGQLDQMLRFNITIIQPRCFYKGKPVRTWSVMGHELRGYTNILVNAANAALSANPVAVTNSECIDCPGRHACPALQKAAYSDAEIAVQSSPFELPPSAAGLELKMLERSLERLQARVEGLRESVIVYIKQGKPVPYYHGEQGYGRQTWTAPVEQVIAMGQLMGVNLRKDAVVTPKQAIKAGVDESVIKAYSNTPLGSLKLIADNPADARRVFGITN